MKVSTLPKKSRVAIATSIAMHAVAIGWCLQHSGPSLMVGVAAFFAGGFLTDLTTGLFHFGFDYVWPPWVPIFGPIAVEFRAHHELPRLDPSAGMGNFPRRAYA